MLSLALLVSQGAVLPVQHSSTVNKFHVTSDTARLTDTVSLLLPPCTIVSNEIRDPSGLLRSFYDAVVKGVQSVLIIHGRFWLHRYHTHMNVVDSSMTT